MIFEFTPRHRTSRAASGCGSIHHSEELCEDVFEGVAAGGFAAEEAGGGERALREELAARGAVRELEPLAVTE